MMMMMLMMMLMIMMLIYQVKSSLLSHVQLSLGTADLRGWRINEFSFKCKAKSFFSNILG